MDSKTRITRAFVPVGIAGLMVISAIIGVITRDPLYLVAVGVFMCALELAGIHNQLMERCP